MRITESRIRRIIREELINEDLQGFLDATRGIEYVASGHDLHFIGQDKPLKDKARAVKRAWMQHSDQEGLQRVADLVHWFSDPAKHARRFMDLGRNNEVSVIMHPKNEELTSKWGGMGVMLKGWITLASNNMNNMMTGYGSKTRAKDIAAYKSSGLRKRPGHFYPRDAATYVLGPEDLDDYESNEALVANWKPVAWVIPSDFVDYLKGRKRSEREEIIEVVRTSELPIIDELGNPMGVDELEGMIE